MTLYLEERERYVSLASIARAVAEQRIRELALYEFPPVPRRDIPDVAQLRQEQAPLSAASVKRGRGLHLSQHSAHAERRANLDVTAGRGRP